MRQNVRRNNGEHIVAVGGKRDTHRRCVERGMIKEAQTSGLLSACFEDSSGLLLIRVLYAYISDKERRKEKSSIHITWICVESI